MTAQEIVTLEDVWVRYDGIPILEGVTLSAVSYTHLRAHET